MVSRPGWVCLTTTRNAKKIGPSDKRVIVGKAGDQKGGAVIRLLLLYLLAAVLAALVAVFTAMTWYQAVVFWLFGVFIAAMVVSAHERRLRDETAIAIVALVLISNVIAGWHGWPGFAATVGGALLGWLGAVLWIRWDDEEDDEGNDWTASL